MKNRNKRYFLIYFRLIVSCLFIALLSASPPAKALVNQQINYQAELTDVSGYAVADGNYDVVFKIYDAASAGTLLWTGTYTTANGNPITTVNGVFSVLLGSGTGNAMSLDFELDTYYLGVKVGADAEMIPRKRMGSVPQAFNAKNLMSNGFINIAGVPTGAGVNQGTVYVNPATATSGYTLLGAAVGGVQKFKLTEAGNLSIAGAITGATGVTSSGTITFSGLATAGIVTNTSGGVLGTIATVPVANGGTNLASYTIGDMIYASGATTLAKLADVATGSVLISGGIGAAPSWGTLGASGITADSLDFTEFKDALTLDASTDISATGTNVLSITNTGTGNSFLVNDAAGDTTPFVIDASGNVGIGTTTPLAIFQIGSNSISTTHKNIFVADYDTGAGYAQYEGNWTANGYWGMGPLTGTADNTIQIGNVSGTNGTWGATQNLSLVVGGNVGIGDTTPASALTVGNGDLFQVNSSGAIAAATGITSSGTITLSGLSTAGIVTNTSGGVLGTVASVPVANGGTNATTIGSAGSLAYSTGSAYAFSAVGTAGQALVSGGTGAPTFFAPTLGSVLFATTSGALAQNNAQFFWDNTNNRLGLGDATPDNQLDLLSSAAINNGLIITNTNAGNYNPNIQFELTENTPLFTFGVDDANGDAFKISTGSDITGTNQFTIDSSGVTSIANLNLGAQSFESDPGIISWIDMPVTSSATIGTVESYTAQLDGNPMITVYGESDGAGSIRNSAVGIGTTTPTTGSKLAISQSSTSTTADTQYGLYNTTADTGIVTTGTDTTYGSYITLTRTGATGGTVNAYGQYITATADNAGAGTSTLYGQYVTVTGADTNYAAAFMGGNVGIGTATPGYLLEVAGNSCIGDKVLCAGQGNEIWTQPQTNANAVLYINYRGYADGVTQFRDLAIENGKGGNIAFFQGSTGNVGIGDSTPASLLTVGNGDLFQVNSSGAIAAAAGITSSGTVNFTGLTAGAGNGALCRTTAGEVRYDAGANCIASSQRYKNTIVDSSAGLDEVLAMRPVSFRYNSDAGDGGKQEQLGFIAEEMNTVDPRLVVFDANNQPYSVKYQNMTAVLAKAIQEQQGHLVVQDTSLATLALKTDQSVTTLSGLQSSVDSQLLLASTKIDSVTAINATQDTAILALQTANTTQDTTLADLQTSLTNQVTQTTAMQTQITDISTQMTTLLSDFQLGNVITKDTDGNVDLLSGKLRASQIITEGLAIDTISTTAPTIGMATLYPVAVDVKKADGSAGTDGFDDFTGKAMTDADVLARDGKTLIIPTSAVTAGSRIFLTPKTVLSEPLAVTGKKAGIDFTVSLKTMILEPVEFDWLIVEEK